MDTSILISISYPKISNDEEPAIRINGRPSGHHDASRDKRKFLYEKTSLKKTLEKRVPGLVELYSRAINQWAKQRRMIRAGDCVAY